MCCRSGMSESNILELMPWFGGRKDMLEIIFITKVLSYENSHKNYRAKPIPIERVCNPEHFDMHLVTKHLMVPKSLCF